MEEDSPLSLSRNTESEASSEIPEPIKAGEVGAPWIRSCRNPGFNPGAKSSRAGCYEGPLVHLGSVERRSHKARSQRPARGVG